MQAIHEFYFCLRILGRMLNTPSTIRGLTEPTMMVTNQCTKYVRVHGRVVVDPFMMYCNSGFQYGKGSLTLKSVCARNLPPSMTKVDISPQEIPKLFAQASSARSMLGSYCATDAFLALNLLLVKKKNSVRKSMLEDTVCQARANRVPLHFQLFLNKNYRAYCQNYAKVSQTMLLIILLLYFRAYIYAHKETFYFSSKVTTIPIIRDCNRTVITYFDQSLTDGPNLEAWINP